MGDESTGILKRVRRSGFKLPRPDAPTRPTPQDYEDLIGGLPPELREDVRQGYLADWLEQDDIALESLVVMNHQLLLRLHKRLGQLADREAGTPPQSAEVHMNSEEAGRYLGMSKKTIAEGAAREEIPGHKFPPGSKRGKWRFRKNELDKWLRGKKKAGSGQKGLSLW